MKSTICAVVLAAVAMLMLAACVTTQEAYERMHQVAQVHEGAPQWFKGYWQKYLQDARGQYAVLALDRNMNGTGWVYCSHSCIGFDSSNRSSRARYWEAKAIGLCEEQARRSSPMTIPNCAIYAVKDEIVWEHSLPWK